MSFILDIERSSLTVKTSLIQLFLKIIINMYLNNPSSNYQPYQSVGSLSMVSLPQIRQQENLDYLENLCSFIDQMNLNPLWFEAETPADKLKLLEVYQTAINYSKNLSQAYESEHKNLEERTRKLREANQEKQKQIREHKGKVGKLKSKIRIKKHKVYQAIHKKLKEKLRAEEQRNYQRRDHTESRASSDRPEIVYIPVPQPNYPSNPYPYPYPHEQRRPEPPPRTDHGGQPSPTEPIYGYGYHRDYNPMDNRPPEHHQYGQANPPNGSNPQYTAPSQQQNFMGNVPDLTNKLKNLIEEEVSKKSLPSSGHNLSKHKQSFHTHKTDKSFLVEDAGEGEEQTSQILKKNTITGDIQTSLHNDIQLGNLKSNSIKKKVSIERENDNFGQLTEKSRKSNTNVSRKLSEGPESNSSMSKDIDSIMQIKITADDKFRDDSTQYQSKISKLKNSKLPPEPMPQIKEDENDFLGLSLRGDSNVLKGSKMKNSNTLNVSVNTSKGIQTSKWSADKPVESQQPLFHQRPQRSDKINEVSKQSYEEDDDIEDFNMLEVSNHGKQDFLKNSTRISKLSGNQEPVTVGTSNLKTSKETGKSNLPKDSEDYSNIKKSNVGGQAKSPIDKQQKESRLFSKRPSRNDKKKEDIYKDEDIQHSDLDVKQQKEDDFGIGLEELEKSRNPQERLSTKIQPPEQIKQSRDDSFEFNPKDLEQSHRPREPSINLKQPNKDEIKEGDDFDVDPQALEKSRRPQEQPSNKLQPQGKSAVNIKVPPSAQSINQKSKYFKIKDQEFKQKLKESVGQKSKAELEDNQDPFDFIPEMPAVSVIAKRKKGGSQMLSQQKRTSIKIPENGAQSFPQNAYSINLIQPDNNKNKLLSRTKQNEMVELDGVLKTKDVPSVNDDGGEMAIFAMGMQSKNLGRKESLTLGSNKEISQDVLKLPKPIVEQEDDEQLNLLLEDTKTLRLKILNMVRNVNRIEPYNGDLSAFNMGVVTDTLRSVCKLDSRQKLSVSRIEEMKQMLDRQMKRVRVDIQNRKNKVEETLAEEQAKLNTPPKLNSPSNNNDSLLYSYSHFNEKPKTDSKKITKPEREPIPDFAESVEFLKEEQKKYASRPVMSALKDNPYLPEGSQTPRQNAVKQVKSQMADKDVKIEREKSEKAVNKFLLGDNKGIGSKEQEQLFKNAGQGISRYDKDDPLNLHVGEFVDKSKKKTEEDNEEEDDEWA